MRFADRASGVVAGDGGALAVTSDAGATWTPVVPSPTTPLRTADRLLIVASAAVREQTERRLRAVSRAGKLAGWFGEHGRLPGRPVTPARRDGQVAIPLRLDDYVHCQRSEASVRLLRSRPNSLFSVLRSKLKWGER